MKYRITIKAETMDKPWYISSQTALRSMTADKRYAQSFDQEQAFAVVKFLKAININAGTEQAGRA